MTSGDSRRGLLEKIGLRWMVCGLLFCATTLNYYDRQILGLLKPDLQHVLGWSERDYGYIVMGFQLAYGCGLLVVGRVVDVLGVRATLALSVALWSTALLGHAWAVSVLGFTVVRGLLGFAEAGNFPSSISAVAQWFPRQERALAIGIFNAGSNVGAMLGPMTVPFLVEFAGWRGAFAIAGSLGALWLAAWLSYYRRPEEHPRLTSEELVWIRSDEHHVAKAQPLIQDRPHFLLRLCVARALTDPVWSFLLFWAPDFFAKQYGLNLRGLALPIIGIYLAADIGGIVGGLLSSRLVAKGIDAARARLIVMFGAVMLTVSLPLAPRTSIPALGAVLIALGASAHQAWSANVFALMSDRLPVTSIGKVVGLTGAAGAFGGMAMAGLVGSLLDRGVGYEMIFTSIVCLYLTGWVVVWRALKREDSLRTSTK